jgi:fluoroacetyl-CoA thioesterase
MHTLEPGLLGEASWRVTDDMTAARLGSGLVRVFSTPMLVALMENAAVAALEGRIAEDSTTVGTHIDVRHTAATPVGGTVRARAVLVMVEDRKLTFEIEAWDDHEQIGSALHERFVVDRARFEARIQAKASSNPSSG